MTCKLTLGSGCKFGLFRFINLFIKTLYYLYKKNFFYYLFISIFFWFVLLIFSLFEDYMNLNNIYIIILKGMDSVLGKETIKLFLSPSEKGGYPKRKEFAPRGRNSFL